MEMTDTETTFRLVDLEDRSNTGQTALTAQLAKLVPGDLTRRGTTRLGMERTDWVDHFGKPKIVRTVLVDAESESGEWKIGVNPLIETGPRNRFTRALSP
jgi:hypothetical protein